MKNIKKLLIGACLMVSAAACSFTFAAHNHVLAEQKSNFSIDGASIRLNDPAGLRFQTTIDSYDENNVYGTLLLPSEKLQDGEQLTFDTAEVMDIQCVPFENENGTYSYRAVLFNIPEADYGTSVIARSYVKLQSGAVVYSEALSRSITYVADKALTDDTVSYDEAQTAVLTKFSGKYSVKFMANGVQVGETQIYSVLNKNISEPQVPEKAGYSGAWESYELTTGDLIVNAVYTANTDTKYTVEHHFENVDGKYILDAEKTQILFGTTDTEATAAALSVEHYSENTEHEDRIAKGNINGDGSLVLKLYYALEEREVTFNFGTTDSDIVKKVKYGGKIAQIGKPSASKYPYELIEWQYNGAKFDFDGEIIENITLNAVYADSAVFDDFETESTLWQKTGITTYKYDSTSAIAGKKSLAVTTVGNYNGIYKTGLDAKVDFTDVNYICLKVKAIANNRITLRFFQINNYSAQNFLQAGIDVKADGAWHYVYVDMSKLNATGTAFNKDKIKTILIMVQTASSVVFDDITFVRSNADFESIKACYDFEDTNGWKPSSSKEDMEFVTDNAISGLQSGLIKTSAWNGMYNANIDGSWFEGVNYIYLKVRTTSQNATISLRLYNGSGIGSNYVSVSGEKVRTYENYSIMKFNISDWAKLNASGTAFEKTAIKTMLIRSSVETTMTIDDVVCCSGEINL